MPEVWGKRKQMSDRPRLASITDQSVTPQKSNFVRAMSLVAFLQSTGEESLTGVGDPQPVASPPSPTPSRLVTSYKLPLLISLSLLVYSGISQGDLQAWKEKWLECQARV